MLPSLMTASPSSPAAVVAPLLQNQHAHPQPNFITNSYSSNGSNDNVNGNELLSLPVVKTELTDGASVPIAATSFADVVQSETVVVRRGRKRACDAKPRPTKAMKKTIIETPRGKSFVCNLYTKADRAEKIRLYAEKKQLARSRPQSTKYPRRARFASARPRVGGRFVSLSELESASIVNGTWQPNAASFEPSFDFSAASSSPSSSSSSSSSSSPFTSLLEGSLPLPMP